MTDHPVGARTAWVCACLALGGQDCAAQDTQFETRSSAVYKLIGAGLALRYEAAACGIVATPKQRETIASRLDALVKEAGSTPAEVATFAAQIKTKIDPLIEANANFCTTIIKSFPSYVTSFAKGRPTAEWEDAAEGETGGSTGLVNGWTVDTQDCTVTYAYKDADEGNRLTGIFLGKVQGAVAVTLQSEAWSWAPEKTVPAKTLINDAPVPPLVDWHSTKKSQFLSAVFPAKTLPDFSQAAEIKLAFDGGEAATFHTPGIADALKALEGCGP